MIFPHGIIQFNIKNKKLLKKVAAKCPIIKNTGKSGDNRLIRHLFVNNTSCVTSADLLDQLQVEVEDGLRRNGINVSRTKRSHEEWVLAQPNNRGIEGPIHRDVVASQLRHLTVLIFFADRDAKGYGKVKLWRNTQQLYQGHALIPNDLGDFKNNKRRLGKCDEKSGGDGNGIMLEPKEYNCAVFDSRLFHLSLPHTQTAGRYIIDGQRVALSFFLTLDGFDTPGPSNKKDYLTLSEVTIVDLSHLIK